MSIHILDKKQQQWAKDKYNEGYTMKQIAKALYVSVCTITRVIENRDNVKHNGKYLKFLEYREV